MNGSVLCRSKDEAKGSPLLEAIFSFPDVVQVWVSGDRVTVACSLPQPWETLARSMGEVVRKTVSGENPPMGVTREATPVEDLTERVRRVLNEDVNPGLAQHGGHADLVEMVDGEALVRLSGGCQGCGAAQMTLSLGIEQTLRSKIPELRGVRDVTDHGAGTKPFFATEGKTPFQR